MNTPTVRTRFVLVLALLVFAMFGATSSAIACVVGTGTCASCTEAALDACLPGGGSFDATVTFACGGAATITVTSTKTISANTTIDGGSVITISGGGTVGVFFVYGPVFAVQNLTIANGKAGFPSYAGGAIFIQFATATVTNSTFSSNTTGGVGGAIANGTGGTLTVAHSTFSSNTDAGEGGAIYNVGAATVTNSTFAGNSARSGGAITNAGALTVTDSTFSGNSASITGGAITNADGGTLTVTNCTFSDNSATGSFAVMEAADGGAIVNINNNVGALTVTDSTFSGNSANRFGGAIANSASTGIVTNCSFSGNSAGTAGGAISNSSGTVTVTNSTFSGNSAAAGGGAIGSDNCVLQVPGGGTVTVVNSILANSTLGGNCGVSNSEFPCTVSFPGTITDGGHNIDTGRTCGFTGAGCATITGTSFCNTNPLLAAGLASNGGPTQTIALEAGSPAINAGDETVCAAPPVSNLDQRGFVRPGMGATKCSIGAYEFNAAPPTTTTTALPPTTTTAPATTTTTHARTTTTTVTPISTTTTTTTGPTVSLPAATTTTTTLPCTTARCILGAALMSPACAGQTIPAPVGAKLTKAANFIDQAAASPAKKARKLLKRAKKALKQAEANATRAAKGKKLSSDCAAALKGAADGVLAGLGV